MISSKRDIHLPVLIGYCDQDHIDDAGNIYICNMIKTRQQMHTCTRSFSLWRIAKIIEPFFFQVAVGCWWKWQILDKPLIHSKVNIF